MENKIKPYTVISVKEAAKAQQSIDYLTSFALIQLTMSPRLVEEYITQHYSQANHEALDILNISAQYTTKKLPPVLKAPALAAYEQRNMAAYYSFNSAHKGITDLIMYVSNIQWLDKNRHLYPLDPELDAARKILRADKTGAGLIDHFVQKEKQYLLNNDHPDNISNQRSRFIGVTNGAKYYKTTYEFMDNFLTQLR